MSLIEILIVISVFAVLGVITTNSILLTLKGARKSESQQKVRENLNYSLSIIERQIRGAENITNCPITNQNTINYRSGDKIDTSFTCTSIGTNGYIASGSARLTADDVSITSCSFSCTQVDSNSPPSVSVDITGRSKSTTGADTSTISVQTEITLRNY